jgi:hypothetical protein
LFKHWKEHYTLLGLPDADRMARQMRLIQLQEWVQSVEDFDLADWRKTIAEEDYLVTRAVVSQQEGLTEAGSPVEENPPAGGNP